MIVLASTTEPARAALAPAAPLLTGDELLELGDIGCCELLDGRLHAMTPPGAEHGRVEGLMTWHLMGFVQHHQRGYVLTGETGIYIRRDPDTVRGMDLAVISHQRAPDGLGVGYLTIAPELVVEILSPSDRWGEIEAKLSDYFSIGVEQVWLVQPRTTSVYVYRSLTERTLLTSEDTLHGTGILAGFSVRVATLFGG
ncbi:MAG: Uma2 family endonuclease [Chloroflexaceae bacterium]|nr:Uma2 family endonuclease [Chloroflexaceae bacterium]